MQGRKFARIIQKLGFDEVKFLVRPLHVPLFQSS